MDENLKNEILKLLIDRNPNWVSKAIIKNHISEYSDTAIENILQELCDAGSVQKGKDRRQGQIKSVEYYRNILPGLAIRETIRVGDIELPRILSFENPQFLPECINEQVEHFVNLHDQLQKQAEKLEKIEIEQRSYWAKTVAVFTLLLGLFVVIFDRMPTLTTSQSSGNLNLLWQNLIVLFIPFTVILIVFAIVIYLILRK